MDDAVSGHYAAWLMGKLSTYGGCNFPDVPCADGGQKVYYPQAYGASVQVPGGAVYLGGMNATSSLNECVSLSITDGKSTPIASLPKPLDNFAAAYHEGMLWVAGGQTNGVPNRDVYSLPYPGNATTWALAAILPDECRLQPCVAVQNTAMGYALFIFGGYQPKTESQEALVHTDGVYMPIAALKKGNATQWKRTAPAVVNVNEDEDDNENEDSHPEATHNPQLTTHNSYHAIVGSTCATSGYSHVLFFGGVDHDILLSAISGQQDSLYLRHQPEWYRFR
jgi:N-acetylneuraminic acid mutarotase